MANTNIPVDLILKNMAEATDSAQKRMGKAADVLLGDIEADIATTPYDVVFEVDRVQLKHYKPVTEQKIKTPLLVVYALINRETMLDLQQGKSVVENFLKQGVDVYMIDWGYPSRKDKYLGIDDHVNVYMDDIVEFIRQENKVQKINIMGICMGGTFSVIYSSLHPEKVLNLVTTVTPTSFDIDTGLLNIWMRKMPVDQITNTFGNIPGDFLNFGFLLLNPARLMLDKYVSFFEHLDDKKFVEGFVRMEKWIFDSPDIPGETFREFIKDCFQENLLIQNKMVVGGQRVNLKKLTMPLLNFYGKFDHLVPPEACEKLTSAVGSKDTEDICLGTGHIGIYVSSKCQLEFTPKIVQWLSDRDKQPVQRKRAAATAKKPTPRSSGRKSKTSAS
ncbi:MAG: class III poly(R)-hydroxyalkanoic acid synthase subunit PhaC [Desulfobulbaceae bacterium]|nr:class III poly(R)-hydroxyalkanoic acid synthase subunit PhaC [Desulfobulbaceae bacterium]